MPGRTNALGQPALLTYPTCLSGPGCTGGPPPISTTTSYEDGFLKSIVVVGPVLSEVSYHASGMPHVIVHGSGTPPPMTETIAQASHGMPRPQSITITTSSQEPPNSFATGTYSYDGAGNIEAMGSDHFRYDRFQRLLEAQMGSLEPDRAQSMVFDLYGNITSTTTDGSTINTPTSTATNRLTSASYDASGNTTGWNGNTYAWDPLNRMSHWANASEGWSYVYTADDERLWAVKDVADASYANWTIRGFGKEVLVRDERRPATEGPLAPEWTCPGGGGELVEEIFCDGFESENFAEWSSTSGGAQRTITLYAYREGKLVASQELQGDYRDFGTDHLGTIRAISNLFGQIGAQHTYFPFGQEATSTAQDAEVMKFTGHERDLQSTPTAPGDDFDYLHARFRSPLTGRFLGTDPELQISQAQSKPQLWNRYAYSIGNPLAYTDPDGQSIVLQVHEVAWGRSHASIRIEPTDQQRYVGRPFSGRNYETGQRFATLGAGPSSNNPVAIGLGLTDLVSASNRERDFDLQLAPKIEEVELDLGGRDENEVIDALFAADANYGDDLRYSFAPAGGSSAYNSNSYASGLLQAVGITPPDLKSNVPGYKKPVPKSKFEEEKERNP